MSRPVSLTARQALFAQETGEAFLILLTIDHASLAQVIRVTSDQVTTVSRGQEFVPFAFDLTLPDDAENASPSARLRIDNVDRQIIAAIRRIESAPSVLMEIVRAQEPDMVEAAFPDFKLTDISYDSQVVEGNLTIEDFTAEPFPAGTFSPGLFPGVY